jgi:hypothetical protein
VRPCSLVRSYLCYSETVVTSYKTTYNHNPKDHNFTTIQTSNLNWLGISKHTFLGREGPKTSAYQYSYSLYWIHYLCHYLQSTAYFYFLNMCICKWKQHIRALRNFVFIFLYLFTYYSRFTGNVEHSCHFLASSRNHMTHSQALTATAAEIIHTTVWLSPTCVTYRLLLCVDMFQYIVEQCSSAWIVCETWFC